MGRDGKQYTERFSDQAIMRKGETPGRRREAGKECECAKSRRNVSNISKDGICGMEKSRVTVEKKQGEDETKRKYIKYSE